MRLQWLINNFDNGQFFYKTMFMNYLKSYEETYKIENLETELSIIKEHHAITAANTQLINTTGGLSFGGQNNIDCNNKTSGNSSDSTTQASALASSNIIKYPNLERLEKDNGKVAIDSEGNVIMLGDYALVDVDGTKQLFKRELIANSDMWIKEDLAILYRLIQEKKNKCIANPELKLEDANMCLFDIDKIKCIANEHLNIMGNDGSNESISMLSNTKQHLMIEKQMIDIQQQIDYIKQIPVLVAATNKEIKHYRTILINKLNSMKQYWKHAEIEASKLEEHINSTLTRNKPCIHYNVTDYYFKINSDPNSSYEFARAIFKNFLKLFTRYKQK